MDIAVNRKAYHHYEILEKYEAGIALEGMEVKSIRGHQLDFKDSYAIIKDGEVWVINMYVKPYAFDGRQEIDPSRSRKLLLKHQEIHRLSVKVQQRGLTLIPLRVYLSPRHLIKIEIGLGKAKKLYDKKETKKQKDLDREMEREIKL